MNRRRRLPLTITLLLGVVLITTVLSAVRFFTAVAWRTTLQNYESSMLVAYTAITGAIWTIVGCFVLWNFFRRTRAARWVLLGAVLAYMAWGWADRMLVQSDLFRTNWRFGLIASVLVLAYTAAVVLDPHNRSHFGKENHERQQ